MGLLSWILAGLVVGALGALLGRSSALNFPLPSGLRPIPWALGGALAGGVLATALGYGGLLELDPRSLLTATLAALLVLLLQTLANAGPGPGGGRPRGE